MTKRRRFGNLRRTAAGRWQVRYPGPDGVPRKGPYTFATKTDAARYLTEVEHELNRGSWRDPSSSSVTLAKYSAEWLVHRRLAPRTRDLYADLLRMHLVPALGPMPLTKISPAEVRRWYTQTSQRTGPVRTRQAYSLLRAILNTAVDDELLSMNPCRITGAGQVVTRERSLLSLEQVQTLIDCTDGYMRPLVVLTFWAHLRLGEVVALRREDVDLDAATPRVDRQLVRTVDGTIETEPKAASRRIVYLPRPAVAVLRDHLASTPGPLSSALFTRPDSSPLLHHHVQTAWQRTRARAGLPTAHFHDLRHAGLTVVAQTGASLKEVMARGGHSTPRAAMIYQHAAVERDRVIANVLSIYAEGQVGNTVP